MSRHNSGAFLFIAILALAPLAASAQWSGDSAENLPIADGGTAQVVPHVAATADGGLYVGWYDSPYVGDYKVMLQRLTPSGVELFPHNGITVSSYPSEETWVMEWALIADSGDNAVLAYNDVKDGNWILHVQKVDPAGNLLWGPEGITLSDNENRKAAPALAEAGDGDIVVVWPEGNIHMSILMQRLSPVGELHFTAGGIRVAGGAQGNDSGGSRVIPSDGNSVIVAWVPNDIFDAKYRQIAAQKFDDAANTLWQQPVAVFDDGTLPVGHYFSLESDGADGALMAWTNRVDNYFNSHAQHLTADGVELWPHNGQVAFDNPTYVYLYPALNYDPATGQGYLACLSQNPSQSQWGLHAQKFAADGARLWGAAGKELRPVDGTFKSLPRSVLVPGSGPMIFQISGPWFPYNQYQVVGLRLDASGDFLWAGQTLFLSSLPSGKLRLEALMGSDGVAKAVWEDRRNDEGDIYGQNVTVDGVLGDPAVPVFLSFFGISPGLAQATITWSIISSGEPYEFRLVGRQDGLEWEVPYKAQDIGRYSARDESPQLANGGEFVYSLFYRDRDQEWTLLGASTVHLDVPAWRTRIVSAHPNPFNPMTTVAFTLDRPQHVTVAVFDLAGRQIAVLRDEPLAAGSHKVNWDGKDSAGKAASTGTYLVRLRAEGTTDSQKLVLVR